GQTLGRNCRIPLLGGVLRRAVWMGAGGHLGGLEESCEKGLFLRRSRCEPGAILDGPRPGTHAETVGRRLELFRVSVCRSGRKGVCECGKPVFVRRRGEVKSGTPLPLPPRFVCFQQLRLWKTRK